VHEARCGGPVEIPAEIPELAEPTEDEVVVLFDRESKEAFQAFLHDPQVRETMKASGATPAPEFTYLDQVAKFPG